MARTLVRNVRLEPGDTVLIGGLPEDMERLRASREILLLEHSAGEVPLRAYAPRAIAIFAMVILAASLGVCSHCRGIGDRRLCSYCFGLSFHPAGCAQL